MWQKRWIVSSHRIRLCLFGREGRWCPRASLASAFHSESRQLTVLHSHVVADRRATCPAHDHLDSADLCNQLRTPALSAAFLALCVERRIQDTHSSSGCRGVPTIRLNMAFCAVSNWRSSATLGVQDSQLHSTVPLTVAPNSFKRWRNDNRLFSNRRLKS